MRMHAGTMLVTLAALGSLLTAGCPRGEPLEVSYDFTEGAQDWQAAVVDYTPEQEELVAFTGEIAPLPEELELDATGFLLGGSNVSDDLFMYLARQLGPDDGIQPNTGYTLTYTITFASNAPTGCFGIGGSPGESVTLKAGAAGEQPEPILDAQDNHFRLNVDVGQQANGGPAASVVSDIANGIPCDDVPDLADAPYVSLTRTHTHPDVVMSDADGNLWLIVGTDSGFEGRTEIYYQSIDIRLQPVVSLDLK